MIHQFQAQGSNANLNFDIDLVPNKQVYCFIGENACGKTNLIENLARVILSKHSFSSNYKIENTKFYQVFHSLESLKEKKYSLPNNTEAKSNVGSIFTNSNIDFTDTIDHIFDQPVVFISANTRGYTQNTLGDTKQKSKEDTFAAFFNQLHGVVHGEKPNKETSLADWIFERIIVNSDFIDDDSKRDHEVRLILELLEQLEPTSFKGTNKKKLTDVFKYNNAQLSINKVPIDKLSTGYVAIIKIFQEIVSGYGAWLGLLGDKEIRNADGIVFIDEIESHLHAKWQFEIIPLLKKFFPKTTFYITTHSPLIISTTVQDEAYELIRDENNVTSKKLGNPQNWYFNSLLMQAFHVPLEKRFQNGDSHNIAINN